MGEQPRARPGRSPPDARRSPSSRPSRRKAWRRAPCAGARSATAASSRASHRRWNPPSPFSATIPPRAQGGGGLGDRPRELRPAARTGDRLGVEAPVRRIGVVARAVLAHRERRHRRLRPVVGEGPRQREARPAMGAVDQRIAEEAARRVEQFVEAGLADRRVRADAGRRPARPGRVDREAFAADRRDRRRPRSSRCGRAAAAPFRARSGTPAPAAPRSRSARPRRRCARSPLSESRAARP